MAHFLEFNDWQFRVINESGGIEYDQPAAASARSGDLIFGTQAQALARTHPQQFSNQFVNRLNADPLPAQLGHAKNHADLIYHHLNSLNITDDLVVSVPSHISNQQLGLLLGIAKEAGLTITGFIDSSLAYCLDLSVSSNIFLLDIELHRAVITQVRSDGQQRIVTATRSVDPMGAMGIIDGWLNVIADEFVQKTRFDPLHSAATEQQLLDEVSGWLTGTPLADRNISVNSGDQSRDIDVRSDVLRAKLAQRLDALDIAADTQLAITPRVQLIPGLVELLKQRVPVVIEAADATYTNALLRLGDQLPKDRVEKVSSAETATDLKPTPSPGVAPTERATHLLLANHAISLNAAQFETFVDRDGKLLDDNSVNEQIASDRVLRPGDQVTFGEHHYVAIKVS